MKARAWLARAGSAVAEVVDASKQPLEAAEALGMARTLERVVAAKGKKVDVLLVKNESTDEELTALLIGPTGRLRAPAARVGTTLLVGFNDEAYRRVIEK